MEACLLNFKSLAHKSSLKSRNHFGQAQILRKTLRNDVSTHTLAFMSQPKETFLWLQMWHVNIFKYLDQTECHILSVSLAFQVNAYCSWHFFLDSVRKCQQFDKSSVICYWWFDPAFCSHWTICLETCRLISCFGNSMAEGLFRSKQNSAGFFLKRGTAVTVDMCENGRFGNHHVVVLLCHKSPPQWRLQVALPGRGETKRWNSQYEWYADVLFCKV